MQIFEPDEARIYRARVLTCVVAYDSGGATIAVETGGVHDHRIATEVARLVPWYGDDGRRGAVLLARSDAVRLNGRRALPLTALRRGDEFLVGGTSRYFTDEAPLRVVPFQSAEGGGLQECTRCHGPLKPGEPVVFCPGCGVPYMAQTDRTPNCWAFGPCLVCGRDPRVEFIWQPEAGRKVPPWYLRPGRAGATVLGPTVEGTG